MFGNLGKSHYNLWGNFSYSDFSEDILSVKNALDILEYRESAAHNNYEDVEDTYYRNRPKLINYLKRVFEGLTVDDLDSETPTYDIREFCYNLGEEAAEVVGLSVPLSSNTVSFIEEGVLDYLDRKSEDSGEGDLRRLADGIIEVILGDENYREE